MENFNRANDILIRNPFFIHKYFMQFCVTFCRYEIFLPVAIDLDLELSWNRTMKRCFRKISLWNREKNMK